MRKRVFAAMAVMITVMAVFVGYFTSAQIVNQSQQPIRENLVVQAKVIALADTPEQAVQTAQEVLQLSQLRATIILADGTIYYDSQKQSEENHLQRPEVQQALAQGTGESVRQSDTLDQQMLYVAVRHEQGDWLVRIAMPFSDILAAQQRSLWEVWILLIDVYKRQASTCTWTERTSPNPFLYNPAHRQNNSGRHLTLTLHRGSGTG